MIDRFRLRAELYALRARMVGQRARIRWLQWKLAVLERVESGLHRRHLRTESREFQRGDRNR